MKNYYHILKVDSSANLKEIKKAYRSLSLKLHPDVNPSDSAAKDFSEVSEAYYVLKDAIRRRKYDLLLAQKTNRRRTSSWWQKVNEAAEKGRKKGYKYAERPVEDSSEKWKSKWIPWDLVLEFFVNLIFS